MSSITGGLVSVEDGVKSAQEYCPPRKVRVELNFDVPEGDASAQGILDRVANMAHAKVRQLLHQAPEAVITKAEAALVLADPQPIILTGEKLDAAVIDAKVEQIVAKRTRRTKAQIAADEAAAAGGEQLSSASTSNDPAAMEEGPKPTFADEIKEAIVPDADPAGMNFLDEPVVETITDAALNSACQAANTDRHIAPAKIKELIASFKTKDPWFLQSIPQEQRALFLGKLAALTA